MSGGEPLPASTNALLRLGTAGPWALFALFTGTNLLLDLLSPLPNPVPGWIALVIITAAAIPLVLPAPDPLPLVRAIPIAIVAPLSAAIVSWNLPTNGVPGYSNWFLGACAFLLFFLALRNRPGWAWIGLAAMTVVTIAWSVSTGQGALEGLVQMSRHIGVLLIATVFTVAFRRAVVRIRALDSAADARATSGAAAREAIATRQAYANDLGEQSRTMLARIERRGELDEASRREALLIEAGLRDRLRGRSFYRAGLADDVRAARARGVDVVLLDDRGGYPGDDAAEEAMRASVAARVAHALGTLDAERVTARLLPYGRDESATIVVAHADGTHEVIMIGDDGAVRPS